MPYLYSSRPKRELPATEVLSGLVLKDSFNLEAPVGNRNVYTKEEVDGRAPEATIFNYEALERTVPGVSTPVNELTIDIPIAGILTTNFVVVETPAALPAGVSIRSYSVPTDGTVRVVLENLNFDDAVVPATTYRIYLAATCPDAALVVLPPEQAGGGTGSNLTWLKHYRYVAEPAVSVLTLDTTYDTYEADESGMQLTAVAKSLAVKGTLDVETTAGLKAFYNVVGYAGYNTTTNSYYITGLMLDEVYDDINLDGQVINWALADSDGGKKPVFSSPDTLAYKATLHLQVEVLNTNE